jgi:iron complex transport system ATP-binding protein
MSSSSSVNEPLVSVRNLNFAIHGKQMVRDLCWTMESGDCVSVVGPNGAGKTTLLRILCGLYRTYEGSVSIMGKEVSSEPPEDLAKLVSLVPQRMEFLPSFSVTEFLELSSARKIIQLDGLIGELGDALLPELSGGELQRVLIAGAVAQGAKILLLDEPTASIDPCGRTQVEEVLRKCQEEMGISYILVTHDISLALRTSSRMLVLANGESYWQGDTAEDGVVSYLEEAYRCGFVRLEHESVAGSVVVPV